MRYNTGKKLFFNLPKNRCPKEYKVSEIGCIVVLRLGDKKHVTDIHPVSETSGQVICNSLSLSTNLSGAKCSDKITYLNFSNISRSFRQNPMEFEIEYNILILRVAYATDSINKMH
jgi:hypothetical protein